MNLRNVADRVRRGEAVSFVARGKSMTPVIRNRERVTVHPVRFAPEVGDVVLAKVHGRYFLHRVSATRDGRFQISNAHGHVNGWASEIIGVVL